MLIGVDTGYAFLAMDFGINSLPGLDVFYCFCTRIRVRALQVRACLGIFGQSNLSPSFNYLGLCRAGGVC